VILAAVIGSFVLGIGGDIEETPQVRLSVSASGESVDISHDGGDSLTGDDLRIIVNNATGSNTTQITENTSVPDLAVGDKVEITYASEDPDPNSIRVRVVHTPSESLLVDTKSST
jgi:FlaG/FlaF family flagellin (archaellin)